MTRIIAFIALVILGFMAYVSFTSINDRQEYIEACLYYMDTRNQKQACYNVYDDNYERDAIIKTIAYSVGTLIALVVFWLSKTPETPIYAQPTTNRIYDDDEV